MVRLKQILRYSLITGLIILFFGRVFSDKIFLKRSEILLADREIQYMKEIFPAGNKFVPVKSSAGKPLYYKAYSKDNKLSGVCFKAEKKGYSSVIAVLAGMDLSGMITGIKVDSMNETPGLGMRVGNREFTDKFKEKKITELADIQAVTGATISSQAVIDAVKKRSEEIFNQLKDAK